MITSNGTGGGSWSTGSSWSGGVAPTASDTVTIASGDTITVDTNSSSTTCLSLTINSGGTLKFPRTATSNIILGDGSTITQPLVCSGTIDMGTVASPIPSPYTAGLQLYPSTNNTSSPYAMVMYESTNLYMVGDPTYNSVTQTLKGYTTGTYRTTLASDALSGTNTLVFADDLGLQSGGGDTLAIGIHTKVMGDGNKSEYITTTAYDSATKTATLASNLSYNHYTGAMIGNVTRNVTISSFAPSTHLAQIQANNSGSGGSGVFQHSAFWNFGQLVAAGYELIIFGNKTYVGCAFYNSRTHNGWCGETMINCVWAGGTYIYGGRNNMEFDYGLVVGYQQNWFYNNTNFDTINNVWFSDVSQPTSGCQNVIYNNCTWMYATGASELAGDFANIYNNCTFTYLKYMLISNANYQFNNCTLTNQYMNYAYLEMTDFIFRNCSITSTSGWQNLGYGVNNALRLVRLSSTSYNGTTYPGLTWYTGGTLTQYTSATCPASGVFPLPSGSSYVGQFTVNPAVASAPFRLRYSIPVSSGQTFEFKVPVLFHGVTSTYPTSSQMYIQLTIPGSTSNPVSTDVVSANDTWTYLSATGTASADGWMLCDLYLNVYQNGSIYIDFPLNMSTQSLVWNDGIPSEQLLPLSATPAGDVWRVLQNDSSATVTGSMGQQVNNTLTTGKFIALK